MKLNLRNTKWAFFIIMEKLLRWAVNPHLRARLLRFMGAEIGQNVRVYETHFINVSSGFRNLHLGDNVHIGPETMIDLSDNVFIEKNSTISPRVMILTHSDPGTKHDSPLLKEFPRIQESVLIGQNVWVGSNSVILAGSRIGAGSVIGACSLVKGEVPGGVLAHGIPARESRKLGL